MDDNTIMPYGQHKGKPLGEIPLDYFKRLMYRIKEKSKLRWTLTEKLLVKYIENKTEKKNKK